MRSKLNYLINISLTRKIKTKWFLVANIIFAIIIMGVANIDSVISFFGGDFNEKTNVYVIDNTDHAYDIFTNQVNNSSITLNGNENSDYLITKSDKNEDELKKLIETDKKEKDSIILIFNNSDTNYLDVSMISKEYIDAINTQVLNTAINNTKTTLAIYNSNISPEQLESIYSAVNINRIFLDENKNSEEENMEAIMTTVFPVVILPFFMLTIFLVQMIGAEVNDEKSTRGMEIIISNVSPKTHFAAKVIASNLFVIIQGTLLFVYAGAGLLIRKLIGGNNIINGVGDEVGKIVSNVVSSSMGHQLIYIIPLTLVLMLLTFVAYSLLAGVLASMTTNIEDFQQMQTPIVIISLVGYYLAMMAGMFKGALFIRILSYIPLISAILSPSLLVLGQIGVIDVIISIILTIVFNYLLIKYGLKIYKVGILNYSSKDLWKKMFKALKD